MTKKNLKRVYRKTKVLVVGEWMWPWYQEACARALESLDCDVVRFGWNERFRCWVTGQADPVFRSWWARFQSRAQSGPAVWKIRSDLLQVATLNQPDVVFFYNVHLIDLATVEALKKAVPQAILCQYANDNPFSKSADRYLWRNFIQSIPSFHLHFAYRHSNLEEFLAHGASEVHLLRSYFIPEDDFPVQEDRIDQRFRSDVVFAGHYENDGRVECLERLLEKGHRVNLHGGGWSAAEHRLRHGSPLRKLLPIVGVAGEDYRHAIAGAKIALGFLSTLNVDTYTRRNFQIPAIGTFMLSQRTTDLCSLFIENKEAAFFDDPVELVEKVDYFLADNTLRRSIAANGRVRVLADGHHSIGRMRQLLETVDNRRNRLLQTKIN